MIKRGLLPLLILLAASGFLLAQHPSPEKGPCLSCHQDMDQGRHRHEPVSSGQCEACHGFDAATGKMVLEESDTEMCTTCHDQGTRFSIRRSALELEGCLTCHDPHGSKYEHMLSEDPEQLCVTCHEDQAGGRAFVHGPVAAGACVACHDPHESKLAALLNAEGSELCLQCHVGIKERLEASVVEHPPVEDCTLCHDPHQSENRFQLQEPVAELCLECHDSVAEQVGAAVSHQPVSSDRACANCHNPHGSSQPRFLDMDVKTLCLSCHDRAIPTGNGVLTNMAALLAENPDHHGPIRENNCVGCHRPHASPYFRLLLAPYPRSFYTNFEEGKYELCFSCHDPALVRNPNGPDVGYL